MASVRPWVIVAGASCMALVLAYVPPRGGKPSGPQSEFFVQPVIGTPARQHAQALAEQWRDVDGALQLLDARGRLRDTVRAARVHDIPLVVVSESGGVMFAAPPGADSAAHLAWRQLGLGETKISVALVIQWTNLSPPRGRPLPEENLGAYLTPDSTDRTTCIAAVTAGRYWTRILRGGSREQFSFADLVRWLKAGFGPCAFYAAYGTPGAPVRSWLGVRRWDLALRLGAVARGYSWFSFAEPRLPWYWDAIYALPPTAVACLAGRPAGCRAAVLAGANDVPLLGPDFVQVDRRWWRQGAPRLVEAERYLGDVAQTVGRDRFLEFWTSAQPVDTALAVALKRPVGEWTATWQRDYFQPIRLGPAPPLGGATVTLAVALLAIAVVAGTASRRQVR